MKYQIDRSPSSTLAVCSCGQRFLGIDRPEALRLLASHEAHQHPGDSNARTALWHERCKHAERGRE